jgi:Spy/CpxP family protein refolding chaperone
MIMRIVTAWVMAAGLAAPVTAQTPATTNMEILRQKIKADKKLVVAQNLKLTDAEGTAFWPVYDAYQKDLQQINQRLTAAILAYANW